ncbi:unnamed protein product [Vitrella brassicaformis CCMP3155]|uniref:Uncharacterized protein n=1 Tax=Vitrella brassicaformis (strain CCMP3155) TaxID=1169540 RepID=A0A0G4EPA8_VITBC|nr:unnamed protein product [Vitrella brassicaformis CCMP3155]|eukprot:CEL99455.1 unnamed protein product [Vitrella brassicaformis CCMP3155]
MHAVIKRHKVIHRRAIRWLTSQGLLNEDDAFRLGEELPNTAVRRLCGPSASVALLHDLLVDPAFCNVLLLAKELGDGSVGPVIAVGPSDLSNTPTLAPFRNLMRLPDVNTLLIAPAEVLEKDTADGAFSSCVVVAGPDRIVRSKRSYPMGEWNVMERETLATVQTIQSWWRVHLSHRLRACGYCRRELGRTYICSTCHQTNRMQQ